MNLHNYISRFGLLGTFWYPPVSLDGYPPDFADHHSIYALTAMLYSILILNICDKGALWRFIYIQDQLGLSYPEKELSYYRLCICIATLFSGV